MIDSRRVSPAEEPLTRAEVLSRIAQVQDRLHESAVKHADAIEAGCVSNVPLYAHWIDIDHRALAGYRALFRDLCGEPLVEEEAA